MKRVINGKVYNTETAELLHSWDNGYYGNDFRECNENLYMTKKGQFFLVGNGGPMSKYASQSGNSTGWGDGLELINKDEAFQWLEDHDGSEVLISRSELFEIEEG